MNGNDNLQKVYNNLSSRYRVRNFDSQTKEIAKNFLINCYKQYAKQENITEFTKTHLMYFWLGAELLDYYNELNPLLGSNNDKFEEGEIYNWLTEIAQKLLNDTQQYIQSLKSLNIIKEVDLFHHKIRFCTAIAINEKYRKGEYDFCLKTLPLFIDVIKTFRDKSKKKPEIQGYEDTLSYLYYLSGKTARQIQKYKDAINYLLYATDCLLSGAISLTETPERTSTHRPLDVQSAHFLLRRVGVTDVARSWTYLAWGRYDAALLIAQQAETLIAKEDKLNLNLAKSIIGIVTKIKAGTNGEKLNLALQKLSESYKFFKENQYSRNTLKILFELCNTYILTGDIKNAIDLLPDYNNSKEEKTLIRLLKERPRWQIQTNLLISRILGKADNQKIRLLVDKGWLKKKNSNFDKEFLLRLAVEYAEEGLKIASHNRLKDSVKEASMCLGKVIFELAEYLNKSKHTTQEAKSLFDKSSKNFEKASEIISRLNVVNQDGIIIPKQLGGIDCNIDDWGYCKLFLAKIAIAKNEIQEAEANILFYQALEPIENGIVKELSIEVQKDLHTLSENTILIEIEDSDSYDHLFHKFLKIIDEKYKIRNEDMTLAIRSRNLKLSREKTRTLKEKLNRLENKLKK